jgi:hypothetical protein
VLDSSSNDAGGSVIAHRILPDGDAGNLTFGAFVRHRSGPSVRPPEACHGSSTRSATATRR